MRHRVIYCSSLFSACFLFVLAAAVCCQAQPSPPEVLKGDIQVERYATLPSQGVRIDRDPVSGRLYYVTVDGTLFEVQASETGEPTIAKVATSEDHGIARLQGMAFHDSTLYLSGNVMVNNGKGTKGRLVRGRLQPDGDRVWSTVFITEEFGTTATTYDHGYNAVTVSPDGNYLYVNSGSRTDHGEVQSNEGAYPGMRDVPLTAAVFRIPTDARELVLRNDKEWLTNEGYLFAEGVRNCFDLAFSPRKHLFCVSNSSDYDHPEEMNWLREGRHYGFPWVMGNVQNPQQFADFEPDPEEDPFLNPYSHSVQVDYWHNDPGFPEKPEGLNITRPVANVGPAANYFRDPETGRVMEGDSAGVAVGTFTPHRSPLGLFFDADSLLSPPFRGDGFVMGWTQGDRSVLMRPFSPLGGDLMHLELFYSPGFDNYVVKTTRLVDGFNGPTDAEMVGNTVYVLGQGEGSGAIWELTFPSEEGRSGGT